MGLLNLHAKKEDFIMQEIFAHLIMYNYCERIMSLIAITQCKDRKYLYQMNYTMAMTVCMDYFKRIPSLDELYELLKEYILPIREGRADKRKTISTKTVIYFIYRVVD